VLSLQGDGLQGKGSIRGELLAKRKLIPENEFNQKSILVQKNFLPLPEAKGARRVGAYISFSNEVKTRGIIESLLGAGNEVFLPVTDFEKKRIIFARFSSFDELSPNEIGIPEPLDTKPVPPGSIDFFIIAGIAFDMKGFRIGWGKGFYDRFFNENKTTALKAGLAFDFQVVDEIPKDGHDVKMDFVVTEKRVIRC